MIKVPTVMAGLALIATSAHGQIAPAPSPAVVPATQLDPARLAAGRDLIALVLPPEQREQMMGSVLRSMLGNMMAGVEQGSGLGAELKEDPAKRAVFERFVERERALALADIKQAMPGLIEAYAHAYARMFTVEEMTQIKAFAATPAGAKFLHRSADLLADPDVGAWQRVLAAKGMARQSQEVEQLRKEMADAGKPTAS